MNADAISSQLKRIIGSPLFSRSARHCRLLEFLVREGQNSEGELKETYIAVAIFGRTPSFDPQCDSIVRVEVGRLRRRLQRYYQGAGCDDPIRIAIPLGSYKPVITACEFSNTPEKAREAEKRSDEKRVWKRVQIAPVIVLACLLIMAAAWLSMTAYWGALPRLDSNRSVPHHIVMAVLPFTKESAGAGDTFGTGLTNQIINLSANIPHVDVVGRTSVFALKREFSDLRVIGKELGATVILEGTVMLDGDHVRVTTQLVDARNGYQIRSSAYDRHAATAEVQNELARAITTEVELAFLCQDATVPERYKEQSQVYALYSDGLRLQAGHDEGSIRKSIEHFRQITSGDPLYAPAFAAEAQSHMQLAEMHLVSGKQAIAWAAPAAARAVELAPDMAGAQAAVATVEAIGRWDWQAAEQGFVRSIELKPKEPRIRLRYAGSVLLPHGRFDEAETQIEVAKRLAPLAVLPKVCAARLAYFRGDMKSAAQLLDEVLELDTDNPEAYLALGSVQSELGMFDAALKTLAKGASVYRVRSEALRGSIYARMGKTQQARRTLSDLLDRSDGLHVPAYDVALVYASLGEYDEALSWLRKAVDEHSPMAAYLRSDPAFRRLRSKAGFSEMLQSMKLLPVL